VIAMTSPPLIAVLAAFFVRIKGGALVSWIMDLNPDEAIAAGALRGDSLLARGLSGLLKFSLSTSAEVVVLDRFMRDRVVAKGVPDARITILPPWAHADVVHYDEAGRERFRDTHGLTGKFVVMYSGNHSPCHPLDTVLEAARAMRAEEDVAFVFAGGGSEFRKASEFATRYALENILCLPYQPLKALSGSLSAADLQLVVMGDPFVGIVHPCKIYNILIVGIPCLYVGPAPSHVSDIAASVDSIFCARHGDVAGVVAHIRQSAAAAERIPIAAIA
jgi:glycosyltransferase involved in cell wall biosynthesis